MAIIDVVKWDPAEHEKAANGRPVAPADKTYAWKYPSTELSTWTQLIVHESQEAVLFRGGAMDGPFGPGRHVLKTENLPVIGKLLELPFGRSPFTAEAWYVNKAIPLDVKWSTEQPIRLQDSQYQIVIPVNAEGQYGVQIENSRKFLVKLVGTMTEFDEEKLQSYFKGLILTIAKTTIAKKMSVGAGNSGISILQIATQLTELSNAIRQELEEQLSEFGLKLVNFFVSHIDVDEDDSSIIKLRDALAKRAEMNIIGFNYQQERSFNSMEGATGYTGQAGNAAAQAGNAFLQQTGANTNFQEIPPQSPNNPAAIAGAVLGAGLGLGMGLPMGQAMGQAVNQQFANSGVSPQQGMSFDEKIQAITKLGELKEKGFITEAQFEIEKQKILNS